MIAADIPAQLQDEINLDCDWERCFREAAAELRKDERAALVRTATGQATHADAVLLAHALGHHDLFPQLPEERPVTPDEDEAE